MTFLIFQRKHVAKLGFNFEPRERNLSPTDFKPMPTVGKGVEEIRIHTEGSYQIFYVARFEEAVYVLHAFQKKTHKTSRQDIQIGQQRYK